MKGNISIGDFIHQVKKELKEAQDKSGDAFYELREVNLEISFVLNASAESGLKLYVVDLKGGAKAEQTHKVSLKLVPLPQPGSKKVKRSPTLDPEVAELELPPELPRFEIQK
jgi:hypothetical protein